MNKITWGNLLNKLNRARIRPYAPGIASPEYQFSFRPYRRPFKTPLENVRGPWAVREGIIVRLEDAAGRLGFGEIAPLEGFGTESMADALKYCASLGDRTDGAVLSATPPQLPCCAFALESALEVLNDGAADPEDRRVEICALLPAGSLVLDALDGLAEQGFRTFKWKIGIEELANEQNIFREIVRSLPDGSRLRLDGNGRFAQAEAEAWLRLCDECRVEFFEQPLSPEHSSELLKFAREFKTPIALDESVAGLDSLKKAVDGDWPGLLVVKPSIMGSPAAFRKWWPDCACPLIFSSAFETAIGYQAGLRLAAEAGSPGHASGFGISGFFPDDGLHLHGTGPQADPDQCSTQDFTALWDRIGTV